MLRASAAAELVRAEYAMRVGEGERYSLFFPSRVRREAPTGDEREDVLLHFRGVLNNVFAALVIRLARTGYFRLARTWMGRAQFEGPSGETCSLTLREPSTGAAGGFILSFAAKAGDETRVLFEEYVTSHLHSHASEGGVQKERRFYCPSCGEVVKDVGAVVHRREQGHTDIPCLYCGHSIPLHERAWLALADERQQAVIADMNRTADARRALDVAALTLRAKTLAKAYDVFFSHRYDNDNVDRAGKLDALLREQGILAWLTTEQALVGESLTKWQEEGLRLSRTAIFLVGDSPPSAWQENELDAIRAMSDDKPMRFATVFIGRLDQMLVTSGKFTDFPVINMQEFTPAAMAQLVEFINGQSGTYIDPSTSRFNLTPPPPASATEETTHANAGVLRFDRGKFFNTYIKLFSRLNQSQIDGLNQLLGFIERDEQVDNVEAAAFVLAVVQSETHKMWQPYAQPPSRFDKSAGAKSSAVTQPGDAVRFRARGYLPIVGRDQYKQLSDFLGIDLISNPDAAREPATAYRILSALLFQGLLTKEKIKEKIVGTSQRKFEHILRNSFIGPEPAAPNSPPPAEQKRSHVVTQKRAQKSTRKAPQKKSQPRRK